jgi:hypothetical protein
MFPPAIDHQSFPAKVITIWATAAPVGGNWIISLTGFKTSFEISELYENIFHVCLPWQLKRNQAVN